VARLAGGTQPFDPEEKDHLRGLLRAYEAFGGCHLLTYCLLDDHIHLLMEVPPMAADEVSDAELLRRLKAVYPADVVTEARDALHSKEMRQPLRDRFLRRMHGLDEYMKTALGRFSSWINTRRGRRGTLWESRYRSVLVEAGFASLAVAAYLDSNPLRAGLVENPADYPWCGYGEAMGTRPGGSPALARAGLARILALNAGETTASPRWTARLAADYRSLLDGGATAELEPLQGPEDLRFWLRFRKQVGEAARLERTKEVTIMRNAALAHAIKRRIRHFSDGMIIGSRDFVDQVFLARREYFGPDRPSGAREPGGAATPLRGFIWAARDLQKDTA
jgi:REP element-mobilizing transposase RayT